MTFLINKLITSFAQIISEFFNALLEVFLEKPALFSFDAYVNIVNMAEMVAGVFLVLSVMKDIVYRLSGIEGNIYDFNVGEYIIKIFFNAFAITAFPKIFIFVVLKLTSIYGFISQESKNLMPEAYKPETVKEFFMSIANGMNAIAFAPIVMVLILLVFFVFGIKALISLAKTQIEVLIATIAFPIILTDLYKGTDKLNSFLMKTGGLVMFMCMQIFLVYFGSSFVVKIPTSMSGEFAWNIMCALASFSVASNPALIRDFIIYPEKSNLLQKGFYLTNIAKSAVKFAATKTP